MELTCKMEFNSDDIRAAIKEVAERLMPKVPGYEVQVDARYSYTNEAIARLVPIPVAEEITIGPGVE